MTREEILNNYKEEEREKIINQYVDLLEVLLAVNHYGELDFLKESKISINDIYQSIANVYGKRANKKELFKYIYEEFKYDFLNRLIKEELKEDSLLDPFIINNLDFIRNTILEYLTKSNIMDKIIPEEETVKYKKLSDIEIYNNIIGFLSTVDNKLRLLDLYNRLKLDNKIIYIEKEEDLDKIAEENNIDREELGFNTSLQLNKYITIIKQNNISNCIDEIHEFIHYLNLHNKERLPITLIEYLPILYEYLAIDYYKKMKINEDELKQMISDRSLNTLVSGVSSLDYLDLLSLYKDNNSLNKELVEDYFKSEYDSNLDISYDEYINNKIDNIINDLYFEKGSIYKDISYILGDILALKSLSFYNENYTNKRTINDLVTNINNYSEEEILKLLNISKEKVLSYDQK